VIFSPGSIPRILIETPPSTSRETYAITEN